MYCKNCGRQIDDNLKFCPECGANVSGNNNEAQRASSGMTCPKCGSSNISIQIEQVSSKTKTKTKKKGCLFKLGRAMLICCTFGLWKLFGKKDSTSKSGTKIKNQKIAICQDCGKSWKIK